MSLYDHRPTQHKVVNVNEVHDEQLTTGAKVADKVATTVGSWPFILIQSFFLACWIVLNIVAWFYHWDPYPFILLNLALSFQAAYSAPFVMMSQNRQAEKDRLMATNDYHTNLKSEEEIRGMIEHLHMQDAELMKQTNLLETINSEKIQEILALLKAQTDPVTLSGSPLPMKIPTRRRVKGQAIDE